MNVFVGSSKEATDLVLQIARIIEECGMKAVRWNQNPSVFRPGKFTLESLEEMVKAQIIGASIFVYTADDIIWYRGEELGAPRDNVIFEHGLFSGKMGRTHSIIVKRGDVKLPSDLSGITYIDFSNGKENVAEIELRKWLTDLLAEAPEPEVDITLESAKSSQTECIENVLRYFCKTNKKALNLKTDIEAVVVVWSSNKMKRRTFFSYNKPKGAPKHTIREYSFGVVGMLQDVISNLDENDKRADCILFYDHEKNPTECEYIIDFRSKDLETRTVEEQEWKTKGTKAMLAISLFRQSENESQVFGALTFDFAETLKDKGVRQKETLFSSVRECRDILIPLLATEISDDYKKQMIELKNDEKRPNKKANKES